MRLLSLVLALLLVCTGCSSRPLTDIEPRQDYAAILRQFLPAICRAIPRHTPARLCIIPDK